jgi:CDP-paratose 2-epimerase
MRVLITGICGFVGSELAVELKRLVSGLELVGLDNLSRPGSEQNRHRLAQSGILLFHGDIRNPSDLEELPAADWVIDAAANPSVLAGISGAASSRQLMEHNLVGTINVLEYCKRVRAGFLMLSTSRVHSLAVLSQLPMEVKNNAFTPRFDRIEEAGFSINGVAEEFPTKAPLSLYGAAKLASEALALEYGHTFDLPVFVDRCGVMAGAGQFGKPDQGIFAYWIHSYRWKRPLRYIGFEGTGHQVRDCLHPSDLASLIAKQIRHPEKSGTIWNVGGGVRSGISLAQLSEWCASRFGLFPVSAETAPRRFDVPWLVLNCTRTSETWDWQPSRSLNQVLMEIAEHADANPNWLDLTREP